MCEDMEAKTKGKRKGGLLPDLHEMQESKKRKKHYRKEFTAGCDALSKVDLSSFLDDQPSPNLDENGCVAWLVNKFGFAPFLTILAVQQGLPESFTRTQKMNYMCT